MKPATRYALRKHGPTAIFWTLFGAFAVLGIYGMFVVGLI